MESSPGARGSAEPAIKRAFTELDRLLRGEVTQTASLGEGKGDIARRAKGEGKGGGQRGHCYCPQLNRRCGQICILPRSSSHPPGIAISPLASPFGRTRRRE